MDFGTLLAPLATGALAAFNDILPVAIPIAVGFAGLGIAIKVFGRFGIRTR